MQAFVINLDSATDRWAAIEGQFAGSGLKVVRVPAVDGSRLQQPIPGFSEPLFRRFHGRTTNLREVGCYLSHVEACRHFLQTAEPFALICEDDIEIKTAPAPLLAELLKRPADWDLVRLSGLATGKGVRFRPLPGEYSLNVNFGRLKGTGAYLVNRAAAEAIATRFLPMRVPYDHAIDREWAYGLRAVSVLPFPICQLGAAFRSSIQGASGQRLPKLHRWLNTYPYQIVNELSRYLTRALLLCRVRLS